MFHLRFASKDSVILFGKMRSIGFFALFIIGLVSAVTQPRLAPVYSRAVDSNPASAAPNKPESVVQQPQPTAEARESPAYMPPAESKASASNVPAGTSSPSALGGSNQVQPSVSQAYPYYQAAVYPVASSQGQYNPYNQVQQPQYASPAAVDFWTKYRITDVLIGAGSLVLIVFGSFLTFPKLRHAVRGSRELSELKAEDLSRMAKSVFQAVEKFYDMNTYKE